MIFLIILAIIGAVFSVLSVPFLMRLPGFLKQKELDAHTEGYMKGLSQARDISLQVKYSPVTILLNEEIDRLTESETKWDIYPE